MLHANQTVSSKRLLIIGCLLLVSMISTRHALADTIFFDDFDDGDAEDAMPVDWVPGGGTWDASSGDYVVTGSIPRFSLVSGHSSLGDVSIRTQVELDGTVGGGLAVRRTSPLAGYAGQIQPDRTIEILRVDGTPVPVFLGTSTVPFDPLVQDVVLQLDAVGSELSLWAWPAGDPMPLAPQLVVSDSTYPTGTVGLVSARIGGDPSASATFRFAHAASTHIPEPSTSVLIVVAGLGLVRFAGHRNRRRHGSANPIAR